MGAFGRPGTGVPTVRPVRVSRSEKFAAYPEWFTRIAAIWGASFPGRVKRARAGSLPALIELKCLDCCCGQRTEVRDCVTIACPLFPVRPFQRDDDGDDSASEATEG